VEPTHLLQRRVSDTVRPPEISREALVTVPPVMVYSTHHSLVLLVCRHTGSHDGTHTACSTGATSEVWTRGSLPHCHDVARKAKTRTHETARCIVFSSSARAELP
jgi:hypothetical protein